MVVVTAVKSVIKMIQGQKKMRVAIKYFCSANTLYANARHLRSGEVVALDFFLAVNILQHLGNLLSGQFSTSILVVQIKGKHICSEIQ